MRNYNNYNVQKSPINIAVYTEGAEKSKRVQNLRISGFLSFVCT